MGVLLSKSAYAHIYKTRGLRGKQMKAKVLLCTHVIKVCLLFIYAVLISTWYSRFYKTYRTGVSSSDFWLRGYFLLFLFKFLIVRPLFFLRALYRSLFTKSVFLGKDLAVDCSIHYPLGTLLNGIVFLAWFCEKMRINIKFERSTNIISQHLENDVLSFRNEPSTKFDFSNKFLLKRELSEHGMYFISPEYGHKILSTLSIKQELKEVADQWFEKNIQGNWVAVHYRGTDVERQKHGGCQDRYTISLESYIVYLKEILDNQCNIFACSDQAQFIDQMYEVFPGRAFARNIQRSCDSQALHGSANYKGKQQIKDALIDILILAKAKLIYTTGSGFVDIVQYFNPKIKIVSLDSRKNAQGKNYMPIPRKDLLEKLSLPS